MQKLLILPIKIMYAFVLYLYNSLNLALFIYYGKATKIIVCDIVVGLGLYGVWGREG